METIRRYETAVLARGLLQEALRLLAWLEDDIQGEKPDARVFGFPLECAEHLLHEVDLWVRRLEGELVGGK